MRLPLVALVASVLGACAAPPVPPAVPAPVPVVAPALSAPRLGTAMVVLGAARPYGLKQASGPLVHRWVPADMLAYEVRLAREAADGSWELAAARLVTLATKGEAASNRAVFEAVPFGARYRAFVHAFGNPGGVLAAGGLAASSLQAMTTVPATADYDFTGDDLPTQISRPVQVVLDAVPFAGTGGISFGAPETAPWVQPDQAITAEARP